MYALVALLGAARRRDVPARVRAARPPLPRRRSRSRWRRCSTPTTGRCSSARARSSRSALLWRWTRAGRAPRARSRDGAARPTAASALLYLPWVPTLALPGAPHRRAVGRDARRSTTLLGGARPRCSAARRPASRCCSSAAAASPRSSGAASATAATAALVILDARARSLLAWLASQISPAFANRYFAAFVGPLLLLAGGRPRGAPGGSASSASLVVAALLARPAHDARSRRKSNAALGRRRASQPIVTGGDLVVSTHPEQLPLMRLLPARRRALRRRAGPGRGPARLRLARRARPAAAPPSPRRRRDRLVAHARARARSSCSSSRSSAPPAGARRGPRSCASARAAVGAPPGPRSAAAPRGRRAGLRLRPLPRGVRAVVYRRVDALATVSDALANARKSARSWGRLWAMATTAEFPAVRDARRGRRRSPTSSSAAAPPG